MNFSERITLVVLMGFCAGLNAQVKNQTMADLLPLLKTNVTVEDCEQRLLTNGFVAEGPNGAKQKMLKGMIDSIPVSLTLRKTSKKGKVWGYDVLFNNAETDWEKKRLYMNQMAQAINVINKQNPSVLLKTLPQYCHGNEAQCFANGMAKYQYIWYWNNAVARIKTMDLRVTHSFQLSISVTDNAMEAAMH